MAQLKCDTQKIKDTGQEIIEETKELKLLFDEMYGKLYSIQKNKTWLGYASDHFLKNILKDKEIMNNFCSNLESYGKALMSASDSFDTLVKKYKRG